MKKHETILRIEGRKLPLKDFSRRFRLPREVFDLGLAKLGDAGPDETAAEAFQSDNSDFLVANIEMTEPPSNVANPSPRNNSRSSRSCP